MRNWPTLPMRLMGPLLLGALWGCSDDPTGPGGRPFCANRSVLAVPTFADPILEMEIREELSLDLEEPLTCEQLSTLTSLSASGVGIQRLDGIENSLNLTSLFIRRNEITDIRPLAGLTNLTSLNLADNSISDVTPLSGLTNLTFLAINQNEHITDISPIAGLTNLSGSLWIAENRITNLDALSRLSGLTVLNAWDNEITDISGLSTLTGLRELRLHFNSITDVRALSGLTNLEIVWLLENPDLRDVQPLIENPGIGNSTVALNATSVNCDDVLVLEAKGTRVFSDCPD